MKISKNVKNWRWWVSVLPLTVLILIISLPFTFFGFLFGVAADFMKTVNPVNTKTPKWVSRLVSWSNKGLK